MHMDVAPHLLTEDRAEFERILDEALRTAHDRPDLTGIGTLLTTAQLRTMALDATVSITTAAATEYDHFVQMRDRIRDRIHTANASESESEYGDTVERPADARGAGLVAVVTVLVPLLAGTTAVILLLIGAVLRLLEPAPAFADTLLTAGLLSGAVAAAGLLCAGVGLLLTALRHRATQAPARLPEDELTHAREAWRRALLDRGIHPFLRDALAGAPAPAPDESAGPDRPAEPAPPTGRVPGVGYGGPDFTSPGFGPPEDPPQDPPQDPPRH